MSYDASDPKAAEELIRKGRRLRTGRSVGRTIYVQVDDAPSKRDLLIGVVDSPLLAIWIVQCCNGADLRRFKNGEHAYHAQHDELLPGGD